MRSSRSSRSRKKRSSSRRKKDVAASSEDHEEGGRDRYESVGQKSDQEDGESSADEKREDREEREGAGGRDGGDGENEDDDTVHAADFLEFDSGSSESGNKSRGRSSRRSSSRKEDAEIKKKEKKLKSMHNAAIRYLKNGDNYRALALFKKILRVHTDHYWNEHSRIGAALHNIAIVHLRTGNLNDAADAIEEAVRVRTLALGEHNSKVVDSIVEKGIIKLARDEYQDAIEAFTSALDVCERRVFLGEKDVLISKIQNNIGCVYFATGDLKSALVAFKDALKRQRRVLEDKFQGTKPAVMVNLSSSLCNVAYVHIENDLYDDAIEVLEEALETAPFFHPIILSTPWPQKLQRKILDDEDPLVFETLDNLGYSYVIDGNFDEAMRYYEELLELQEDSLGRDHFDCSETLKKMTYIDLKRYQLEDAREKIMRTQKIQGKHLHKSDKAITKTSQLLDDVNYELLRYPTPSEALKSMFSCFGPAPEYMAGKHIRIEKPQNRGKVSGHKIAYY